MSSTYWALGWSGETEELFFTWFLVRFPGKNGFDYKVLERWQKNDSNGILVRPYLGEASQPRPALGLTRVEQTALGAEALRWERLHGVEHPTSEAGLVVLEGWPEAGVVVRGSFMPGLDFILSFEKPLKGFKQRRDSFRWKMDWSKVRELVEITPNLKFQPVCMESYLILYTVVTLTFACSLSKWNWKWKIEYWSDFGYSVVKHLWTWLW